MEAVKPLDLQQWWDDQRQTKPERALLNVLERVLESPGSPEARGADIADGIARFLLEGTADGAVSAKAATLWDHWLEMASHLPHGHEWHDCLSFAIEYLRKDKRVADTRTHWVCAANGEPGCSKEATNSAEVDLGES